MIAGIFHEGSGIGDQLFRYITVRTLAEEKGFEWAMVNKENFKGESFLKTDLSSKIFLWEDNVRVMEKPTLFNEKDVRDAQGNDIRSYDPEINFVGDNTVVDGSFEDDKYWGHNLENINKWLAVEPLDIPDDMCVVGFRGEEYTTQSDLYLPYTYWLKAYRSIKGKGARQFEVHTDDPESARVMLFPRFMSEFKIIENEPISHSKHTNMGFNWRSARYAKYAIIPNSAFFILPRLLKHFEDPTAVTIAPRYWARYNTGVWARPACYYKQFTYI